MAEHSTMNVRHEYSELAGGAQGPEAGSEPDRVANGVANGVAHRVAGRSEAVGHGRTAAGRAGRDLGGMVVAALSLVAVLWGGGSVTLRAAEAGTPDNGKAKETQAVAPATPARVAPAGDVFQMPKKFKSTRSGLGYVVLTEGKGPKAVKGQRATVHYTGWLTNGKKFDSSRDANRPFTFQLGAGMVIDGWDEGVAMMKVGDKYTFIVPSQLGYGAEGAPPDIPPGATLIFNVELLSVR